VKSEQNRKALQAIFDHFNLGEVGEIRRVRAGRHQRSEGAWSWYAGPRGSIGSQWPLREVFQAFRKKLLTTYQDPCGDINLIVE